MQEIDKFNKIQKSKEPANGSLVDDFDGDIINTHEKRVMQVKATIKRRKANKEAARQRKKNRK